MAAVPSIGRASAVQARPAAPEADLTRALYERHSRQIFNYCLHQLGNREEAEDATQTTFLNAFRGLQRGVVPELESAWLFKIANNVILTRRRSSFRRRRVETPGDLDALQDVLPSPQRNADELIRLNDALAGMPDQQRRALLLREWQGLSYHEIGEELGLSQSAVETLLFRARRSLAEGLTDPDRTSKRGRLRSGLDLGSLLGLVKGLLTGGAAVKAVATAAVVASSAVVVTDPVVRHRVHETPAPAAKTAPAPTRVSGPVVAPPVTLVPHAAAEQRPTASTRRTVAARRRAAPIEHVPAVAPEAATPDAAPPPTQSPPAPPTATTPVVPEAAPTPAPQPPPTTVVETQTTPVEDNHPNLPVTTGKTDKKVAALPPVVAKGPDRSDRGDTRAEKGQGRDTGGGKSRGREHDGDATVVVPAALKKPTFGPVPVPVAPTPAGRPSSDTGASGNAAPPGDGDRHGKGIWKKQDTPQQSQPLPATPPAPTTPAATTPTTPAAAVPTPAAATTPTVPTAAPPPVAAPTGDREKGNDGSRQNDHDAGNRDGRGHGRR